MTDQEQVQFEAELRQIKPVKLPEELGIRLRALDSPNFARAPRTTSPPLATPGIVQILRWLIPATALIVITLALWPGKRTGNQQGVETSAPAIASTAPALLKADNIQIGKELVSSFDTVATLPGGEPVRFRVQQWMEQVVVDDKSQGLLVESRMPRVVVVPVRFETY